MCLKEGINELGHSEAFRLLLDVQTECLRVVFLPGSRLLSLSLLSESFI